ncbi:hypothetical protein SASPL_146702 [Salvia splendens]|uniref:Uncharacterized protein n=1 Tax=Salvia splendens TaxID=180675 RepID=A0A8X8WCM4_SALSN|nr:hypothetical protein SASPL_146702 [Salvia splendens]
MAGARPKAARMAEPQLHCWRAQMAWMDGDDGPTAALHLHGFVRAAAKSLCRTSESTAASIQAGQRPIAPRPPTHRLSIATADSSCRRKPTPPKLPTRWTATLHRKATTRLATATPATLTVLLVSTDSHGAAHCCCPGLNPCQWEDHPNENELLLVQDFFGYTEDVVTEGAADDTYIKMGPEKDNNEFIEKDIDSPQNDTFSGNREIFAGQVASGDVDFGKSYERIGGYGGPRGSFRCGFSNGDEGEGDHPRRPLDRRSRIGCDYKSKREGAGRGTCGTWTDEMVNVSALYFMAIRSTPPLLGVYGLYMGSIPERVGQFLSHGLQAGISEVTKIALLNVAHSISELQVESVESLMGTFLGTTKIGCEVLMQRWQTGQLTPYTASSIIRQMYNTIWNGWNAFNATSSSSSITLTATSLVKDGVIKVAASFEIKICHYEMRVRDQSVCAWSQKSFAESPPWLLI